MSVPIDPKSTPPTPLPVEPVAGETIGIRPTAAVPTAHVADALPVATGAVRPPPIPVEPFEPAWPQWRPPRRPGLVSGLGISSITLAGVSMLTNFGTFCWAVVAWSIVIATATPRVPFMVTPPSTGGSTPAAVDAAFDPQMGLDDAQQSAVVEGLNRARPLSATRTAPLKRLLRKSGQKLFSFPPTRLTVDRVKQNVNTSGQLYADNESGADFYVLAVGRLEINDRQAVFTFDDRSEATLRSDDAAASGLSSQQVSAIVEAVAREATLNAGQRKQLKTTGLSDPTQAAFDATEDASIIGQQVRSAAFQSDNTLMFVTPRGSFILAGDGTLSPITPAPGAAAPVTTGPPRYAVSTFWPTMFMLESVASFLVAVLLLIAGIFTMRSSKAGPRLHWIYAVLRVPLSCLGALASGYTMVAMSNGTANMMPTGAVAMGGTGTPLSIGWVLTSGVVLLLYPITVACLLLTPSVRAYFKDPHGDGV